MPALTEEEYLKQQQWEKEQERKRAERTKQLEDERKFGPQAAIDRPQDVDPWEWSGMSREQQLDIDLQRRMQDPALIEKYSRMTPEQLQASAQQSLAEIEYHKEKKIQKYREERPWEAAHDKSLSSGERLLGAVDHYKKRLTDHRYDQQYGGAEDRMIVGTMKRLPISGAVWSAMSHRDKKATMDRIASGKGTDADYMRLGRYIAEEEHKANRSGFTKALDIASYIPGYATEFFMTGGAYAAGRKAAQRGAMGAFGRAGLISKDHIPRGVGTAVKAAGFVGGTARQAAHPFMWGRAADEFLQRRDPGFKLKGKSGSRGFDVVANEHSESIGRHVYEAMWSHYLEIMTERSGATLMKGAGAPFRALTARLPKTHLQKVGASVMRRSREFSNATGMSFNPIEEYVEEVAGSVLKGSRYTAGEDPHLGRLWKNFITNPTNPQAQKELWEETGPMLAAFAMAGVGGAALSPMQDRTDELAQQIDYQQQLLDQMPEGTPEHARQQEIVEGLREQKIERDSTQEQAREEYMERGPRYTGDRRNREAVEAYAEELTEWRKENPLNAALREIDYRSEGAAKGYIDAEISALEAASNEEEFRSAQASLERKMEILEKSNLSRKDVEELFPDPETRSKALRSARGRSRFMGTLEGMSSQIWQAVKSRGEELGIGVEAPARKQVMAHAKLSDTYVRGEEENRPKATKPDVQIHNMTLEEFRKENYQEETEWYLREKVLADGTKVGDSPERLLQYYEEKYPDSLGALGIRIGGAIETEKSGPLGNRAAVVWKRDEEDKAQLKGAIIVLPPDAGLVVTRHEIEHLLDVIHGYDPTATEHKELRDDGIVIGAEKHGRFDHKYFNKADYLHRALVRDALLEGEQVSEEVLAQYKNDPAIQELLSPAEAPVEAPAEEAPVEEAAAPEAAAPVPEKKEGAAAIYQYLELHDISENPTDAELLGLEKGEELDVDVINEKHEAIHKEVDTLKLGPRAKESQELLNRLSRARLNLIDAAKEAKAKRGEAAAPVEVDPELAEIDQGLAEVGTVGTEAEQVAELQKLLDRKRKRGEPTPKVSEALRKRAEAAGVPLEGENIAQRVLDAEAEFEANVADFNKAVEEAISEAAEEDGDKYFSQEALDRADTPETDPASRKILIHMSPADFLAMAESGVDPTKAETVSGVLKAGDKFEDLPYLMFEHDGEGVAQAVGHEGRHRARALQELGVESMPVVFWSNEAGAGRGIRWGRQKKEGFDQIKEKWPQTLKSEDGKREVPFPVADLRAEAPAAPKAAEPKKGDQMPRISEAVELPEEVKREAAKKAAPFKKKVQEVEDKRLSVWEEGTPTLEELKELSIDELRTMVREKYGLMKSGKKWQKAPFPLSGKGVTKAYLASKLAAPQRDNIMVGQSVHYISEGEEVGPSSVVALGRSVVLVKGNAETKETIIDRNDIVKVIHGAKTFELDNDGGVIEILFSDAEEIAENGGRDGKKWRETFEKFWLYYAPQWADWGQKIRKERWYRQYFNVGGLLGKDLHSQLEMLEGKTAANVEAVHQQLATLERALRKSSWAEGIKKRDKVLRNLSNEKKKVLNGILKIPLEEMDAYSKTHSLPEGVVPVAKEIRKRINSLSRDLREIFESDVDKKLGLEKKYGEDLFEVLLSNEGIYLRRNYQVFNDPKYGEKLFEADPDWVDRDGNKVKLLDEARKMIREGEYYYKRRKKMKRLWRKRIKGLRRDLEDQIKKEKEQLEADNVPAAAIGESLKVSREDFWSAAKEKAKQDAEEGLKFMDDAEVEGALKAKLAPEKGQQMSIRTRNSLGRVDMNSLIQRKLDDEYYHRVIRTLYGEITDFDLNALATVERVSSMINQTQAQEVMLEHFKEVGWVDVDPETGEIPKRETYRNGEEYRHKMPDNQPEFGVFQGLYLTMDAKQALIDYYGNPNNTQEMSRFERFQKILFFKVYGKTIGLARASKTILSTTVQWRNFWANATLGFVNGHFSLDGTVGQNFIDAFAITAGQQGRFQWSEGRLVDRDGTVVGRQHVPEIVQELVSRKVIGDSPSREIENLLNASWDAPMSDVIRDNVNPTDKKGLADAISIVKKGGPLDKVWNVSASLYQAGDDIWKVFGWLREVQILEKAFPTIESIQNIGAHKKGKKKGDRASLAKLKGSTEADRAEWIKDEAALRIRDMYPTFSNAPFWVKAVRWFPLVGTFPTYFEELVRTQYIEFFRMTARDIQSGNPVLARRAMERRLRWVGAHAALGAGIKAMLGLLVRLFGCTPVGGDDEALLREGALPPWSKHSSIFAWRCGKGSPKVIDLSFVLPLERPWDAVRAGISEEGFLDKGTSVLNELVGDVITTDMAVSRSAEAVMGRTGSGAPLYMESDSTARKTVRRAAHLWGIFEPGVVNSTRRIITGLAKKPSMTGRKYNPAVEALSASFGTRVNDIDVPESLNYQIAKFNRNLRGSRREMERYGMSDYQPSMIFPLDWEGSLTQFKRELPKAERARKQVFSQGHNAVEMARRMGMKDSDIVLTLKKHNLSKRDIAALLNKTYPPYLPSKPMRIKILKQGYAGKQKWDIIKQNFIKEVEAEKKRQKEGKPFWSSYPAKKG